jgi:membrane protein
MYYFIPNVKVKFAAAFNSSMVVSFAFVVVQFFYLETQILVSGLNAVYGVFAAIPLFLVWMNISWTIILFGAELSHAYQNVDKYKIQNENES